MLFRSTESPGDERGEDARQESDGKREYWSIGNLDDVLRGGQWVDGRDGESPAKAGHNDESDGGEENAGGGVEGCSVASGT